MDQRCGVHFSLRLAAWRWHEHVKISCTRWPNCSPVDRWKIYSYKYSTMLLRGVSSWLAYFDGMTRIACGANGGKISSKQHETVKEKVPMQHQEKRGHTTWRQARRPKRKILGRTPHEHVRIGTVVNYWPLARMHRTPHSGWLLAWSASVCTYCCCARCVSKWPQGAAFHLIVTRTP